MKVNVCLLCLKTFESCSEEWQEAEQCNLPLLPKFLKFTENYLEISTTKLLVTGNAREVDSFCEKCELAVVNPICQLYQELMSVQLRLAWELKQMGTLLENSQNSVSDKLKLLIARRLTDQLGVQKVAYLEEYRSLLIEKCHEKGSRGQPKIILQHPIIPPYSRIKREVESEHESELVVENSFDIEEMVIKPEPVYGGPTFADDSEHDEGDPTFYPETYADSEESNSSPLPSTSTQLPQQPKLSKLTENGDAREVQTPEKGIYPCKKCTKVFPFALNLSKHLKKAHPSRTHLCSQCNEKFKSVYHLRRHERAIHKPESHSCSHCQRVFITMDYLRKHIQHAHPRLHKPIRTNQVISTSKSKHKGKKASKGCSSCCGQEFRNDHLLQLHIRFHHKSVKCSLCDNKFNGKKLLYAHIQRAHKGESGEKAFPNRNNWVKQMSMNSDTNLDAKFCCSVCEESFVNREHLKLHIAAMHIPESHPCPHCKSVLPMKTLLQKHIRRIHPDLCMSQPTKNSFAEIFKLVRKQPQENTASSDDGK